MQGHHSCRPYHDTDHCCRRCHQPSRLRQLRWRSSRYGRVRNRVLSQRQARCRSFDILKGHPFAASRLHRRVVTSLACNLYATCWPWNYYLFIVDEVGRVRKRTAGIRVMSSPKLMSSSLATRGNSKSIAQRQRILSL